MPLGFKRTLSLSGGEGLPNYDRIILGMPGVVRFFTEAVMQISKRIMAAISAAALSIAGTMIVELEGVEYEPYADVAGVLTVCYGITGRDVIKGKTYTENECRILLDKHLTAISKKIDAHITVPVTPTQRAALYSFAYNVGPTAFNKSTLLKKLNSGDGKGACEELKRWVYADGKKWKGLESRRDIERSLCLFGNEVTVNEDQ